MIPEGWYLSSYAFEHSGDIPIEFVKGAFEQAEKRLVETVETAKIITERGYKILTTSSTLLTLVFGYFVSVQFDKQANPVLELASLIGSVALLISAGLSMFVIWPYKIQVIGSEPAKLLVEGIMTSPDQVRAFFLNECNDYQNRISQNNKSNSLRRLFVTCAIAILVVLPGSLILSFLLYK